MPFWDSSAFWGIAGIVGGILVSTFFFIRGKSKKILKYEIRSTVLITKNMLNIPEISITLAGQPVQSVTSSTIKFTNIGNQAITSDDFAKLAPLRISVKNKFFSMADGFQIVSDNPNTAPVLHETNEKAVVISFDFLRPKQSFSITFLHDGALSADGHLKTGEMIDAASIKPWIDKYDMSVYSKIAIITSFALFCCSFGMLSTSENLSIIKIAAISIGISVITFLLITAAALLLELIWSFCSKIKELLKSKFKS